MEFTPLVKVGIFHYTHISMVNLLASIAIGLALSAPLGPIGMLCLHYAFSKGFRIALLAGLGAALADTLFVGIATFGLSEISEWLLDHYFFLGILGGFFLTYLGWRIYSTPIIPLEENETSPLALNAFTSTFIFTLSNPLTILVSASLIGCLTSAEGARSMLESSAIVLGVFIGCMIWWITMSAMGSFLREKMGLSALDKVKQTVGIAIMIFGAVFIASAIRPAIL